VSWAWVHRVIVALRFRRMARGLCRFSPETVPANTAHGSIVATSAVLVTKGPRWPRVRVG